MLAITCETAARNELTAEESLQILVEAIAIAPAAARQLLDELSHSILIRTPAGISFQMRSYGEYLAAVELHDKSVDRLKELAFLNNAPVDTWLNAVTHLAEMNDQVRRYFAKHYPEWLINVSPAAFTEDERTSLARQLLHKIDECQSYLVNQRVFSWPRLARLLTTIVIAELRTRLASTEAHQVANALVLLGILRQVDIVPQSLQLATAHRNPSLLRYSAIIALINSGDHSIIDRLIAFAQPGDNYHIHLVDAIGSLCAPADFPRVLPLLEKTNAGLSAAYYHFREFRTKEALTAAIDYITANPGTLYGSRLDPYLEPLIDLIPDCWDSSIADKLGLLLATLERSQLHRARLAERIIMHVADKDHDASAVRAMITSLMRDGIRLRLIADIVAPIITLQAAKWIAQNANEYAHDLAPCFPRGPVRDILSPQSQKTIHAHEEARTRYAVEQHRHDQEIATTRGQHQTSIRADRDINAIVSATERLPKEHWPEISSDQKEWLTQAVNDALERLDLANSITWLTNDRWTQPQSLNPLLNLTDYYNLRLKNDVPLVFALRSWPDKAISNYYRRHGLSSTAQEELANTLRAAENESIARNILAFLRATGYHTPTLGEVCTEIALDTTRAAHLRIGAIDRLGPAEATSNTLLTLTADEQSSVRHHAFRALIKCQHRATISRALATLTDDELRNGEVPIPESSPLDWIGDVNTALAIDDLRKVHQRTVALDLWRVSSLVAGTIANIDKRRAAAIIRQQLPHTPIAWREHVRQEADNLERGCPSRS